MTVPPPSSVYEIERAETRAEILRLERAMLTHLDDTRIQREQRGARLLHAVFSGLGPLIGILIPLVPFLFEGSLFSMIEAALVAIALGVAVLGTFGAYMWSISGQRWYVAAARMGLAGLVVAGINWVLPGVKGYSGGGTNCRNGASEPVQVAVRTQIRRMWFNAALGRKDERIPLQLFELVVALALGNILHYNLVVIGKLLSPFVAMLSNALFAGSRAMRQKRGEDFVTQSTFFALFLKLII